MDLCIICLNDRDLLIHDNCCRVFVHQECLDRWNKISNYKCLICKKNDGEYYNEEIKFLLNIDSDPDKLYFVLFLIFVFLILYNLY